MDQLGDVDFIQPSISLPDPLKPEPSLLRLLIAYLEHSWCKQDSGTEDDDDDIEDAVATAVYRSSRYLRRRAPDEIEAVLATMDHKGFTMLEQRFGQRSLDMQQFVEAVVQTGTYDPKRALAFVGGVTDLFLEVYRSQAERAEIVEGAARAVCWGQLMNHLIETPELAMFKGSFSVATQEGRERRQEQMHMNSFVDAGKHQGPFIDKIYWYPSLDVLTSLEGTDSIYFWSPHVAWDTPKILTPDMGPDDGAPISPPPFVVQSVAWDVETQELLALLSNRMLVQFRLRSRDKIKFQQKRCLTFNCFKAGNTSPGKDAPWWISLRLMGYKAPDEAVEKINYGLVPHLLRRDLRAERQAAESANMEEVWWNASNKCWITTDLNGKIFFWNLRELDRVLNKPEVMPVVVLKGHRRSITSYVEVSAAKFATCSLDRTIIIWDARSLIADTKLKDHIGCVLSMAYLPQYSSLVTVACEPRVLVWSVDATGYRGSRGKLAGHGANLQRTTAGEHVFFTLDEEATVIVWDAATLVCLQSFKSSFMQPKHILCLPSFGRLCLAGRRLTFYEGDDDLAVSMGAAPSKEQLAKAKQNKKSANFKHSATPRWCGISESRGAMLSATEAEVRLHTREFPDQSRVIFNAPEGDLISGFAASDKLSLAVVGTSRGAIHFLKYRSGFALQVYPGRREDARQSPPAAHAGAASSGGQTSAVAASPPKPPITTAPGGVAPADVTPTARPGEGNAVSSAGSPTNSPANADTSTPTSRQRRNTDVTPVAVTSSASTGLSGTGGIGSSSMAGPNTGASPPAKTNCAGPAARPTRGGGGGSGPKGFVPQPNAPSAEELQSGVSTHIQCIRVCEESKRIFVGTIEGQVLVFSCEPGFPAIWWLSHPFDPSAVTCLACESRAGPRGLLAVGTQDGLAHVYTLGSLRLGGSVNIPNALPDFDLGQSVALSHLLVVTVSSEPDLPLTLLTIDAHSRLRFWGMRMDGNSGLIADLRLLLDANQLPVPEEASEDDESKGLGDGDASGARRRTRSGDEDGMASGVDSDADGEGKPSTSKGSSSRLDSITSGGPAAASVLGPSITAMASLQAWFVPPTDAPAKQPKEGPRPAAVVRAEIDARAAAEAARREEEARKAAEQAALDARVPGSRAPSPPSRSGFAGRGTGRSRASTPVGGAASAVRVPKEVHNSAVGPRASDAPSGGNPLDGDSEGEDEKVVQARLRYRARSPRRKRNPAGTAPSSEPQLVDGDAHVFFGDSFGRIWCVDIASTLKAAQSAAEPRMVPHKLDCAFQLPTAAFQLPTPASYFSTPHSSPTAAYRRGSSMPGDGTASVKASHSPSRGSVMRNSLVGHTSRKRSTTINFNSGPVAPARPPPPLMEPNPEALCIAGGRPWRAHGAPIASLAAVGMPPVLVSADAVREVKVWSTSGDLWGHFSLGGANGIHPAVAVWPPPHPLAVQVALMKTAKRLCKSLGLQSSQPVARQGSKQRKSSKERSMSELSLAMSATARHRVTSAGSTMSSSTLLESRSRLQSEDLTLGDTTKSMSAKLPTLGESEGGAGRGDDEGADAENEKCAEGASPHAGSESDAPKSVFTQMQLREMVRSHAFSAGCQSYKDFTRMPRSLSVSGMNFQLAKLEERRSEFMMRPGSGLGMAAAKLDALGHEEMDASTHSGKGLGRRAASDSILLRYVQNATDKLITGVREELGVDVTRTKKRDLRNASFVASLDIGQISSDPNDPSSATAEAARLVVGRTKRRASRKKDSTVGRRSEL